MANKVFRLRAPAGRRANILMAATAVLVLCVIAQAVILPTTTNLSCSLLVALSTLATVAYCFQDGLFERFTLSTLAVVGYNAVTQSIALIAQTAGGVALVFNLHSPGPTFRAIAAYQLVILGAHYLYTHVRALNAPARGIANHFLKPLWFFRMPSEGELWVMGLIGMLATWVSRVFFKADIEYGDVGGKSLQALVLFTVFPFFIPFRGLFLVRPMRLSPQSTVLLLFYGMLTVLTAVAMNQRVQFSFAAFTILLSVLVMFAMRRMTLTRKWKLRLGVAAIVLVPLFATAQDLATAMEMAREVRGSVGTGELIRETLRDYSDKPAIERYRRYMAGSAEAGGFEYSDAYIKSTFINRLVYTKYTDTTMTASARISDDQRQQIQHDFLPSLVAILPTPLTHMLGFDIDKTLLEYSGGDVYENMAYGRELGSFLTGSSVTSCRDTFGYWWPMGMGALFLVLFITLDSLLLRTERGTLISPVAFMILFFVATRTLIDDSILGLVDRATRFYLQNLVTYLAMALVARAIMQMMKATGGGVAGDRVARRGLNAVH